MAISKKQLISTIVAVIGFVILIKLGFWQIARGQEKQHRLDDLTVMQEQQPTPYRNLNFNIGANANSSGKADRTASMSEFALVSLDGQFFTDRFFLLDNRIRDGRVGYEVIMPMRIESDVVLVNIGWIKAPPTRDQLPTLVVPQIAQKLITTFTFNRVNHLVRYVEQENQWPRRIQQVDSQWLSQLLGSKIEDGLFYVADPTTFGLKDNWRPVSMKPQRHYAYALQWFGLGVAWLVVVYFAVFKAIPEGEQNDAR
jgi:cytochrome oxidase assembly protein ShyY1